MRFVVAVVRRPGLLVFSRPFDKFSPIGTRLLGGRVLRLGSTKRAVVFSARGVSSIRRVYSGVTLVGHSRIILSNGIARIGDHFQAGGFALHFRAKSKGLRPVPRVFDLLARGSLTKADRMHVRGRPNVAGSTLLSTLTKRARVVSFARRVPSVGSVFVGAISNAGAART